MMYHSVNQTAIEIAKEILDRKESLRCIIDESPSGATLIDAGIKAQGSFELGRLIGEVCLGGLGAIRLTRMYIGSLDMPATIVSTSHPKIATLGSQYAGWTIKVGKYFAMGSGPARALARVERELYDALGYEDHSKKGVIILESRKMPTEEVIAYIAEKCHIAPSHLYCIVVPTASIAGSVQIAARIVEVGMHKLHQFGFDLERIRRGHGVAPIAPVAKNDNRAMGVTNDCILYGGRTFYYVRAENDDLQKVVDKVPSSTSKQYGQPFYDLFKSVDFDFYKIDPLLFSPAEVTFNIIESTDYYHAGAINPEILEISLGQIDNKSK
ncbi:MAG: methenyltetrahydromethanopterin cyclohydrolase [Candidatus Thorarchaeota archaeon]|nr:methenyltetrahydromethanopterin cyclohydrolase [Candidatus Thorarchaeota archaeon]